MFNGKQIRLNHIIRSHKRIGHDESVPVRVSADVFWYALAYLAYMVRIFHAHGGLP